LRSVIIIGVGKLGIRHLEAIFLTGIQSNIWVVDKSAEMLVIARELSKKYNHLYQLNFSSEIPDNLSFDLGIIATDSRQRFEIATVLLEKNFVRNLLLEKIIFPISTQYFHFKKILEKSECQCFVNLPRRLFPHYELLRNYTYNANHFKISVEGASWGLLSNSLHFVDLFHFLFDVPCDSVDSSKVSNFFPSKRNGYLEANGSIELNFTNKGTATLVSTDGNFEGISIDLSFDDKKVEIHEKTNGFMQFSWDSEKIEITPLMVTETTSTIWKNILEDSTCDLPSYLDVYLEHYLFIESLEGKYNEVNVMNPEQIWLT